MLRVKRGMVGAESVFFGIPPRLFLSGRSRSCDRMTTSTVFWMSLEALLWFEDRGEMLKSLANRPFRSGKSIICEKRVIALFLLEFYNANEN